MLKTKLIFLVMVKYMYVQQVDVLPSKKSGTLMQVKPVNLPPFNVL